MADYLPASFQDRAHLPAPDWERKLFEVAGSSAYGPFLRCVLHRNDPAKYPVYFTSKFLEWDGTLWGLKRDPEHPEGRPSPYAPWDLVKDGCSKLANELNFDQQEAEAFIMAIVMHVLRKEDLESGARTMTGEEPNED